MILYVATSNAGKLRDFVQAATPRYEIQPLPGLADIPAPEEDQPTFSGNARLKGRLLQSLFAWCGRSCR